MATPLRAKKTSPGPVAEITNVSPQIAETWLTGNTVNRKIRGTAVRQYADDMIAGRWTANGDAICFSPDGKLLNGQHRLCAVVAAEVTVPMLVMRNVPQSAMDNMDAGRKRTAADMLGFDGEANSAALASAVKLALLYADGRLYRDSGVQSVSNGELREFLEENPDLRDSVAFMYASGRSIDLTPTVKIVAHWLFARSASTDEADLFFELLASRVGLAAGSPILALDSRIRELRKFKTRLSRRDELGLVIKAWNYWRSGRTVQKISAKSKAADARIPAVAR